MRIKSLQIDTPPELPGDTMARRAIFTVDEGGVEKTLAFDNSFVGHQAIIRTLFQDVSTDQLPLILTENATAKPKLVKAPPKKKPAPAPAPVPVTTGKLPDDAEVKYEKDEDPETPEVAAEAGSVGVTLGAPGLPEG